MRWSAPISSSWLGGPDRTPCGRCPTPAGNLFLHYALDSWVAREFPQVSFERHADDAVLRCASEAEAQHVLKALADRMAQVGLELHPDKTRIVYCKDGGRKGSHEHERFNFLGYTFRPRRDKNKRGEATRTRRTGR